MAKNKNEKKSPLPSAAGKKSSSVISSGISDRIVYIIMFVMSFVLYGNTIGHDYAVDDAIVITDNMYTVQGVKGIPALLTHDTFLGFFKQEKNLVAGGRYRPLSLVTFAIEYQFFGLNPKSGHFFNIIFYALAGIAIYLLLKRLLINKDSKYAFLVHLPLIATLLFMAHPIHTEAVANVKGRDEILSLLFSVMAANFVLKYLDEGKKMLNLLLGFASLLLGLLSKENAITFFAIIPMMVWFFRKAQLKDYIAVMAPVVLATGLFLILRQSYTNTSLGKEVTELMNNPFFGMTVSQKLATIIFTFGKYLSLLVLPITLSHDYYPYQITIHDFSSKGTLLSLVVCVGAIVYALTQLSKKTILSFSILFFALTFSVVSNLVFPVGTFMSERFLFMPSLAFCLMLGYLITLIPFYRLNTFPPVKMDISAKAVADSFLKTRYIQLILAVLIGGYSVRTIVRNPAWRDNFTLFMTDINNSPNSAKLNDAVGGELITQSDRDVNEQERLAKIHHAIPYLYKALQIYPRYTVPWLLLGNAYFKGDKDYAAAFDAYKHALLISPDYGDALRNMSILMTEWKDYPAKTKALKEFISEQPTNPSLYFQLGQVYNAEGSPDSAIAAYRKAISIGKNYTDAYCQMGRVYGFSKNKLDSAVYYLRIALQIDNNNMDAYENLGVAYGMSKDYKDAEETLLEGIKRNPNDAKMYLNLGITYSQMGNQQKSQECMSRAYELDPSLKPR